MVANGIELCLMGDDTSKYEAKCDDCPYFDPDIETFKCKAYLLEDAHELLKEQETIFERDGHHIRCTHCNSYWCSTDREGNAFPTNYCPNCGRKVKWE